MATRDDVLDAIGRIEMSGGGGEATRIAEAALTLPLPPSGYDRVLDQLRSAGQIFAEQQQGPAAAAMRRAELALSQQLSHAAEFDRQVIEALRRTHKTSLEGRRNLDDLQTEIAGAAAAWDLSTAPGAREFRKYLIAKLGEIVRVVQETNDDDTSKQALAIALAALYAAEPAREDAVPSDADPVSTKDTAIPSAGFDPAFADDSDLEPYPDLPAADQPETGFPDPAGPMPALPGLSAVPGFGGDGPGFGAMPVGPVPGLPWQGSASDWGGDTMPDEDDYSPDDVAAGDAANDGPDPESPGHDPGADDPVPVRLPDGETTSVADPQLAAAMQAVADGQPVAQAFGDRGIPIPPPGMPVTAPIDVDRLRPGDIGVFTDRHALAVGNGRALLDGQLHAAANLQGPGFLGWQHLLRGGDEQAALDEPAATRPADRSDHRLSLKNPITSGIVDRRGR